ncbi:MAG: hypothetical protein HQL31_09300, partial [Planctomycetes bacterium]|nr:hypothetical protein [Planctomycetota bacterium]
MNRVALTATAGETEQSPLWWLPLLASPCVLLVCALPRLWLSPPLRLLLEWPAQLALGLSCLLLIFVGGRLPGEVI